MNTELLKIMKDAIKGRSVQGFSKGETSEVIRKSLLEISKGETNPIRLLRKCPEVYELVEELIPAIISEGFKSDDAILSLVDYRDVRDGDELEFVVEDNSLFVVAETANGVQSVRRQRVDKKRKITIPTSIKMIRIYEHLSRLLSGKVDFYAWIERVGASFQQKIFEDAYAALDGITKDTAGLDKNYVVGSNVAGLENTLLTLINHVEAATGKSAVVYGSKAALRKIPNAVMSNEAKSDLYNVGYFGKFNGTNMVSLRQLHKAGTSEFALNDDRLYVLTGDEKPIKVVTAGDSFMREKDAGDNMDLTQEYIYGQATGVAVVCSQKFGVCDITG